MNCFISLCLSSSPSVSGLSFPGTVVSGPSLACTGCSGSFRRWAMDAPISSCVPSVVRDQQKPADNLNAPTSSLSGSLPAFSFALPPLCPCPHTLVCRQDIPQTEFQTDVERDSGTSGFFSERRIRMLGKGTFRGILQKPCVHRKHSVYFVF